MAKMELEFTPDWRFLRQLRTFVSHMVTVRTQDPDLAARVGMAVTELAENAIKYSVSQHAFLRIQVENNSVVRVEAENEAAEDQIAELKRIMDQVNEGDSTEAYMRALLAAAESDAAQSKVGLARVRFEGQMVLRVELAPPKIRVIAERAA
jgi:hypothetical protein